MRINVAVPEAHVQAPVLDAALESVTRLNESLLASDQIPSFEKALRYGVKWKPEPPGAEHFDHGGTVIARKWGDCDDLAPYHAASLRHSGEDPGATAIVQKSGPSRWHAVVQRSNGDIDDPSKRAGMGGPHAYLGAALPLMYPAPSSVVGGAYIIRPQIALRPVPHGWQARADIPWHHWDENDKPTPSDYAMATLHRAPVAHTALTGAIDGACRLAICGGFADPEHIQRLSALADMLEGAEFDEVAEEYGDEHAHAAHQVVGSFFSHLNPMHLANSLMHNPLTSMAANFVPGGRAALDMANMASSHIPGFGGGHGGGGGAPHMQGPHFPGGGGGISAHRATILFE